MEHEKEAAEKKGREWDAYQLESYKMVPLQKMKGPALTLARGIKEARCLDKLQNQL
jgi:cytochrome c2